MKELRYRDYVIAAHAVSVGASTGVRYAYQGEIYPAVDGMPGRDIPGRFESDVEGGYINAASAVEACLEQGQRLIDARLGAGTAASLQRE
ncbi:hypothetical protein CURE108131_14015 [Cupriavidus respiraculi]|uniref:Uncharacterized protein n=1 Tax=Cupriavidus respiraculi TaxID=195930 RepID=A0ABM8XHB5_9BURK|nr:hypothetical protein [Cupriavidus respiraculi]MBY4948592.1 hypothetical protein [Cupriavidus respiraculi]CAG9179384.1 hypothetical protein LMG21510_03762 [Cupriavidus respiraculi]